MVIWGTGESLPDIIRRAELPISVRYSKDFIIVWRDPHGLMCCASASTARGATRLYREICDEFRQAIEPPPTALPAVPPMTQAAGLLTADGASQ